MEGFTRILSGCRPLLKPGGFLVIAARPFRRLGQLVDIPTMATNAALAAGFTLHERCVALLAATRDDGLMARASFFQLVNARNAFAAGNPTHVTAHEEIIVARVLQTCPSSRELKGSSAVFQDASVPMPGLGAGVRGELPGRAA